MTTRERLPPARLSRRLERPGDPDGPKDRGTGFGVALLAETVLRIGKK